eukprot:GILI01026067.1.p1 GENE.GILI01026067.1~~GILI01026067.1.p1  ORF type:complete len:211 (+),score=37.79 GILI01026067.1:51-683(+)
MRPLVLLIAISLLSACCAEAYTFDLPARGHRCFTEELVGKQEFEFNYGAAPGYAQFVDVKVSDPHNTIVWTSVGKDRAQWKTRIEVGGEYAFCFYSRLVPGTSYQDGMKRAVYFELSNSGNSADDYVKLASQKQLKPLEVNLRIMEDAVRAVHTEYVYLKERESAMRDTSEHMFNRAMWLAFLVMFIIVGLSLWQIRHVKSHFKKKRMLD